MAATGRELILRALQEVGVLAAGEDVAGVDLQDAHLIAKRMMNTFGADRLAIHQVLRTALTLTSGTRDYSIGPGGAIDMARPLWIERAGHVLDSSATDPIELPLEVLTETAWARVRQKTFDSGYLKAVYYDRRFDSTNRGLLSTYPTINASNRQLVIYTPQAVTGFDSLTTQYVFPPAYEDAWHYELALRLCGPFGVPTEIRQRVKDSRTEAWGLVHGSNVRVNARHPTPVGLSGDRGGAWSNSDFDAGGL